MGGKLRGFAGARGEIAFSDIASLGSRWAAQPKRDGVFAELRLDSLGCIASALSSTGRLLPLGDLVGVHAGRPNAVLAGELEALTEASLAAIASRGYSLVHLFDCLHDGTRPIHREPYGVRRDALLRMAVELEMAGDDRPWGQDRRKRGHRVDGRFSRKVPRSWRRVPVVPQVGLGGAAALWEQAQAGELEGLVLVNLDAPAARMKSKLKCKPWASIDCYVHSQDTAMMRLEWSGGWFIIGTSKKVPLWPGCWAEVQHNGFDKHGRPKHPRIVRRREDLEPGRVLELDALPGSLAARLSPEGMTEVEPWRRERA